MTIPVGAVDHHPSADLDHLDRLDDNASSGDSAKSDDGRTVLSTPVRHGDNDPAGDSSVNDEKNGRTSRSTEAAQSAIQSISVHLPPIPSPSTPSATTTTTTTATTATTTTTNSERFVGNASSNVKSDSNADGIPRVPHSNC